MMNPYVVDIRGEVFTTRTKVDGHGRFALLRVVQTIPLICELVAEAESPISAYRCAVCLLPSSPRVTTSGSEVSVLNLGTKSSAPDMTKTSSSVYFGSPFSVFRVMRGIESCHPRPKGPLPLPVLYCRVSCGPKPARPGEVKIGTEKLPVPEKRLG